MDDSDEVLEIPRVKYVEEIGTMLNEIEKAIRHCNRIVPDDWIDDPNILKTAHALSVYRSVMRGQEELLQRKKQIEIFKKKEEDESSSKGNDCKKGKCKKQSKKCSKKKKDNN